MADSEEDTNWTLDLETALIEECDFATINRICKGRPVPDHLRAEIWQICLGVTTRGDQLASFDELYDMSEQDVLREDCQALVDKLGNDDEEKISVASDLESILTFYCKNNNIKYSSDCGWLEVLQPMLALKFSKSELYNVFQAFIRKFIPRDCVKGGQPFHLFRLLLQYHDPELCSFLDTRKITPDTYAPHWLRDIFAGKCDLKVTLNMWDVYLQHSDPFLVFFLSLVILVNAKDQLLTMKDCGKDEIIEKLVTFPSALEADDIEDFCSLALYYSTKTPQSFRKDYVGVVYGETEAERVMDPDVLAKYTLCLPVMVEELVQLNQSGETIRYFVVDCRPADQYNSGHLATAFHLDANLMLQSPVEFTTAVDSLLTAQKHALAAGSAAGGEHLCFMGSGREEEDQYVHMVVARFLQHNSQYVSLVAGGYTALHEALGDDLTSGLADHSLRHCIVCNPDATSANGVDYVDEYTQDDRGESLIDRFEKLSSVVKSKSSVVKEKMISYIKNETGATESRHVSSEDRVGKRYRNTQSVFTIGDDEDGEDVGGEVVSSDDERRDIVNIETWLNKPDVKFAYPCQHVKETGFTYPSFLMVTDTHLFILRVIPNRKGFAWVQARRALGNIVKITSKKRTPDLITFKYGFSEEKEIRVTDLDRMIIPKAAEATKNIRVQILSVLDSLGAS